MTIKIIKILPLTLSALALIALAGCDSGGPKSGPASGEPVTLSTYKGYHSALLWIAKNRGYFSQHGVNVRLQTEESGVASLGKLVSGQADLATVADFAFVSHLSQHPDLRILAVISEEDDIKLIARRDRGISQISDLKNKRIGLVRDSVADYYLHLLLMFHRINYQDIEAVNLSPSEQEIALAKGDIDASVFWWPVSESIEGILGTNAISWSAQKGQDYYWLLIGIDDTLKKRSAEIRRILAALASAEEFMKNQPDEARRIVDSETGSKAAPELWESAKFELALNRPALLAMEAQFRWMKTKEGIQDFRMPDFLGFIYFDALKSVKPEKIKIIH